MRYRIVMEAEAVDYDDGIEAAVKHCKNVALNRTSLLMRTFDDALPDEEVRASQVIDSYVTTERPGSRHTFVLGKPEPAFPPPMRPIEDALVGPTRPPTSEEAETWRQRAFYYAKGQIDGMNDLSPLTENDASTFGYWFQQRAGEALWLEEDGVSRHQLRAEWVDWSTRRLAAIREHGVVKSGTLRLPRGENVDYLGGGEHDPDLGPDMGDQR